MPQVKSPARRRYTRDHLFYEAFYVALRNALIAALTPIFIFLFMSAIENYDMKEALWDSVASLMEVVFVLAFFINFFYYIYFVRLKRLYAYALTLVISCGLAFVMFFSDYKAMLKREHEVVLFGCWFLVLAILMLANRIGFMRDPDETRYDQESWLYKHALSEGRETDDEAGTDREEQYRHRYVDTDVYASDAYADEGGDNALDRNREY